VLKAYVERGGTLVAEARLGWNNERGYAADRVPGLGLWEVMGAREVAIETAPKGRTALVWSGTDLPGVQSGDVLPARWYKETLEPLSPQARVVARFEDGAPAAVMSAHGKGRTLMLGSYVSAAYQTAPSPEVERFYGALLEWAGVVVPVRVAGSPLEVRSVETARDTLIFLFNHGGTPARSEVFLRRPAGTYAATIPLEHVEGGVTIAAAIAPSSVRVLHLSQR
jgi:beta-galactosidase